MSDLTPAERAQMSRWLALIREPGFEALLARLSDDEAADEPLQKWQPK